MFANYRYFLVLCEEKNITRAAERLFITHQNLSKYLSNLEKKCGVALCRRKPVFALTHACQLLLDTFRQVEAAELNLEERYRDLQENADGELRLGTTEGRFRILMPDVISAFSKAYPHVRLLTFSASSPDLRDMILNNQLDLMVVGLYYNPGSALYHRTVLNERLYLVISDNMLARYFPNTFPACKKVFVQGADLSLFTKVPFAFNLPEFNSSRMLQAHLAKLGVELDCVHTSSHPDLHHMMSARDHAASFCLTMYLPQLLKLNKESGGILNVFPIKGLTETNPVVIAHAKARSFGRPARALIDLLCRQCRAYGKYDLPLPE